MLGKFSPTELHPSPLQDLMSLPFKTSSFLKCTYITWDLRKIFFIRTLFFLRTPQRRILSLWECLEAGIVLRIFLKEWASIPMGDHSAASPWERPLATGQMGSRERTKKSDPGDAQRVPQENMGKTKSLFPIEAYIFPQENFEACKLK